MDHIQEGNKIVTNEIYIKNDEQKLTRIKIKIKES